MLKQSKNAKKDQPSDRITVEIPPIRTAKLRITIEGLSPLMVQKFSEKAKRQIEEKQQKTAKAAKQARDPEAEFRNSLYTFSGKKIRYGIPVSGIKNCAVSACRFIDGIPMTRARGAFHITEHGDGLIEIKGSEPVMDSRPVRIGKGLTKVADIRYRGRFDKWNATFDVMYNTGILSSEQIINLFENAGFAVGLCEYRPEKNGNYGMFEVKKH